MRDKASEFDQPKAAGSGFIAGLSRFALILVALGICAVIVATNMPEYRELLRLKAELQDVREMEEETLLEKDRVQSERIALQTDEEFLQLRGRDLLDLALPGETIIRIERAEER